LTRDSPDEPPDEPPDPTMTGPNVDEVVIAGAPEAIWAILDDPSALGRVLPGCESVSATGPTTFQIVLAVKVMFMTIRADVSAAYHDLDEPRHLRLAIDGRPRGVSGAFVASIPIDLVPEGARTRVRFSVDVSATGALASFGPDAIRGAMRDMVGQLARNVERELSG
jgi:carbon monoxide dehydrogenase subunit G